MTRFLTVLELQCCQNYKNDRADNFKVEFIEQLFVKAFTIVKLFV